MTNVRIKTIKRNKLIDCRNQIRLPGDKKCTQTQ